MHRKNAGFTLVEILTATALTLLLMAAAVNGFGLMAGSISTNQAIIETSGRLRSAQTRLQLDLRYATAKMLPPLTPSDELGYFEIIEGPGPWSIDFPVGAQPVDDLGAPDSSVGDVDDVLMFTCRSYGDPFVGLVGGNCAVGGVADVSGFMRGNKLYRRQLLVLPAFTPTGTTNFYGNNDVSVHQEGGQADPRIAFAGTSPHLVANSLGDLTKRENRFAHQPLAFPHDVRFWGQLGLPLIQETTNGVLWPFYGTPSPGTSIAVNGWTNRSTAYFSARDFWESPMAGFPVTVANATSSPPDVLNNFTCTGINNRFSEDLILDNVIGFDVKVWDTGAPVFAVAVGASQQPVLPTDAAYKTMLRDGGTVLGTGAYVDLFYTRGVGTVASGVPTGLFAGPGDPRSQLAVDPSDPAALAQLPAVYCTWSTHYENDGIDQDGDGVVDEGSDGLDNDGVNGVDDPGERETAPPYSVPLRSIQVKIRVFEPDSRQIREVTVVQDFVR